MHSVLLIPACKLVNTNRNMFDLYSLQEREINKYVLCTTRFLLNISIIYKTNHLDILLFRLRISSEPANLKDSEYNSSTHCKRSIITEQHRETRRKSHAPSGNRTNDPHQ
jgi:hypothetical protein